MKGEQRAFYEETADVMLDSMREAFRQEGIDGYWKDGQVIGRDWGVDWGQVKGVRMWSGAQDGFAPAKMAKMVLERM